MEEGAGIALIVGEERQGRPQPPSQQHPSAPGDKPSTRPLFSILYFNDHILTLVTALKGFFGSCCVVCFFSSLI